MADNPSPSKSARRVILITIGLVFVDRVLKAVIQNGLLKEGPFFYFEYPRFTLYMNPGLAGSVKFSHWLIVAVSVILIVLILVWLAYALRAKERTARGIIVLLGGAFSNFFDRIVYGAVIDTIEIAPEAVWNIADFMIAAGILLIVFSPPRKK